ncbi:MAG TPA: hypothetical protein VFE31_06310 [Opitutaceae bacterium]|nr:hypothetical protein [Opitutaceae bacterium]
MSAPSDAEFRLIVNATDEAVISIRGHVAIDAALGELIAAALPSAHEVEIERMSFSLKVDLSIGLCAIHPGSRSIFIKLNKIRNLFAHSASATLGEKDKNELKNSMGAGHREMMGEHFDNIASPRDALQVATVAAFYETKSAARHLLVRKLEREEMANAIGDLLKEQHYERPPDQKNAFAEKVQERVRRRLVELGDSDPTANGPPSVSPEGASSIDGKQHTA